MCDSKHVVDIHRSNIFWFFFIVKSKAELQHEFSLGLCHLKGCIQRPTGGPRIELRV